MTVDLSKTKTGIGSGLVAGFALFSSFMGIDSHLNLPPGTFYEMVGTVVGLSDFAAIAFGFFAHMSTAALIGVVFCVVSTTHRALRIITVPKGVLAGGVTGLVVFAIFFMPIHTQVMVPTIDSQLQSSQIDEIKKSSLTNLLEKRDQILAGSLLLHLLFGVVMGFFSGMMLHGEYKHVSRAMKFL